MSRRRTRVIICADCGNDARACGRGLCVRCYSKHQRAGTLETYPSTKRRRAVGDVCRNTDGLAPTLKVALDALVTEQVLADDNYTHVPAVTLRVAPPKPGEPAACWVTIQPDKEQQ